MSKKCTTLSSVDLKELSNASARHQRYNSDMPNYDSPSSSKYPTLIQTSQDSSTQEINRIIEIFENNDPKNWNAKEVSLYLELIGLSSLIPTLSFLDGNLFLSAKEKDLIDLKIKDKDQRRSILLGIEALKETKFKYDKKNPKTWNMKQCCNWFRACGIYGKEQEEIIKKMAIHGGVLVQLSSKEIIERFKLKTPIDIIKAKAVEQLLKVDPTCFENSSYMSLDSKKIAKWLESVGFNKEVYGKFLELKITGGIIASIPLKELGFSNAITKSLSFAITGLMNGKTFMNVDEVCEFYKDLNLDIEGIQIIQENCIHGLFLSQLSEKDIKSFFPFKDSDLKVKKLRDEIEKMEYKPYGSLKRVFSERTILIEKHEKINVDLFCTVCYRKCMSVKFENCEHGVCEICLSKGELECKECK